MKVGTSKKTIMKPQNMMKRRFATSIPAQYTIGFMWEVWLPHRGEPGATETTQKKTSTVTSPR